MHTPEEIRARLSDADEETRHAAVQSLALLGGEALPLLAEALGDKSWRVRKAALEAVIVLPGPEKLDVLLKGVRDEESAGRRNTCTEALIRLGEEAISLIPALLADPDPDIRKFGVDILGNIQDVRVHGPLLEALEDSEDNVAAAAAEYLGRKRHREAVPALVARMEQGAFWVKYSCLQALGEIGDPAAGPAVLKMVGEGDLRKVSLEALGRMGVPEAEPIILEALFSGEQGWRKTAILAAARLNRLLGERGGDSKSLRDGIRKHADEEFVALVKELLRHGDEKLRAGAMFVLGAAAGKGAVEPLLAILPGIEEDEQAVVAEILQQLPDEDLPALFPSLRDEHPEVRKWAATILGRRLCRKAVPQLIGSLEDENGHVRGEAAKALGDIGDQMAIAPLIALMSDPYPDVRQTAVEALIRLGEEGEEVRQLVLNFLEPRLDSPDQDLVASALRIAARLGGEKVMSRLEFCLKDERSQVRRAAVEALGVIDSPQAIEILRLALTDEDTMVRREAVQMMGNHKSPGILPFLVPMLNDEDLWVRVRAVQAVVGIDLPEAHRVLMDVVEREAAGPVKLAAIRALGQAGVSSSLPVLLSLVDGVDRESRMAAIEALGMMEGEETVDKLISCLSDDDWGLRSASVKSLGGLIGTERVRTALAAVADKDADPMVRRMATDLLEKKGS
jgi:HEAT repeat protein